MIKLKIKTWEAMEKEFGKNLQGHIDLKISFTKSMELKIPTNRLITATMISPNLYKWDALPKRHYTITMNMIESIIFTSDNSIEKDFKTQFGILIPLG